MRKSTIAIIQARMGSSRFPGKSLEKIGDWSLVELVLKRVKQASRVDIVVLATSTNPQDDILADSVRKLGFPVVRGSEDDVLSRFYQAAELYHPDTVVRITGDCPLISPTLIDYAIRTFEEKKVDYLTIVIGRDKKVAYPRGFDVEVVSYDSLKDAATKATKDYEREHVMPYFYTHPNLFSVYYIEPEVEVSRPMYRLCVDSKLDLEVIQSIHKFFGDRLIDVDFREIIDFLDNNPEIALINETVEQKHYSVSKSK